MQFSPVSRMSQAHKRGADVAKCIGKGIHAARASRTVSTSSVPIVLVGISTPETDSYRFHRTMAQRNSKS